MKPATFTAFLVVVVICISFFSTLSVNGQSTVVTTTTTIRQPPVGQCSEVSIAFSGQQGQEIAGTFGSDSSISFYVLTPADFMAIQNPTCSLPPSSRPLYSEINVVGYDNSYRSLPFPTDGTYYFVFTFLNSGISQLVSGYANLQLTYPASTVIFASTTVSSTTSPSSTSQSTNQTTAPMSQVAQISTSAVSSTGPSIGIFGVIGIIVVVAIVASVMVFMKRGKGAPAQKAVLEEPVKKEVRPEAQLEPKSEVKPALKPEAKPESPQPKPTLGGQNISTGYSELDTVLAGGLPIGYAILIVSPPCDERDLLFRKIIESSLSMGSQIFFLSRDLIRTQDFANRYGKDFHVFSPQADKLTSAGGNVYKIQGLQNLSDLNISFTKAVESLPKNLPGKLIIIDILSDILLEHKALTTRKWLDGFVGKRKAEGFTIIGVLNPLISSQQDTQTITDLFDGVIEIYERELKERARRFLIVKKLYGRKYVDTELMLDKDKLY